MNTTLVPRSKNSLSKGIEAIKNADLTPIKRKLMEPEPHGYGWTQEQAEEGEVWYKRYLTAILTDPEMAGCVPNVAVDRFWHCHILDTAKYMEDCNNIFGFYLHHNQYVGMNGDEKVRDEMFSRTNKIFEDLFGENFGSMKHFPELTPKAMCEGTACIGSGCRHHEVPAPSPAS
ncbi:MAG: hypothetical protein PHG25_03430 [Candidatus Pacebacteria bacterium]|nr:hypothetical protein [Candidatus Paceibacterota bacterium]